MALKGSTEAPDANEKETTTKSGTTTQQKKASVQGAVFPTDVVFKDRGQTPEEVAQRMGEKANTGNLAVLTIFGALAGVMLLAISIYLSHIEALNSALIIAREGQYAVSLGLSLSASIFSVIGFQQLARWWKYKEVEAFLPDLVKAEWMKEPASQTLYNIMIQVIEEGRKISARLAFIFLAANLLCSALILWAVWTALPPDAPISQIIYTLSISGLAFISGACISLLTAADITENSITSMSQKRYLDYAKAQSAANEILGLGKK